MAESSGMDVSEEDLLISARTVIHSCMEVREHENVLIVTDTKTTKIARAVYEASSDCLLYTSPSPRDVEESRMPSSA